MSKFIIVPGCSDLNRGDQALVWETRRLAEECGYEGDFYLSSEENEPVDQSKEKGLHIITPILEHPSRKFQSKENISYTKILKIKWGIVSVFDFFGSLLLLWKPTRKIAKHFLSKKKQQSLKVFEKSDTIFMKGGGLLQTYGGLSSTYSMYFGVYPLLLAHKLKKLFMCCLIHLAYPKVRLLSILHVNYQGSGTTKFLIRVTESEKLLKY